MVVLRHRHRTLFLVVYVLPVGVQQEAVGFSVLGMVRDRLIWGTPDQPEIFFNAAELC